MIAERFRFHRSQVAEESIMEYIAELRRLVANCDFGDYLDEALLDRLVCWPLSDSIQRHLLTRVWPQFHDSGGNSVRDGGFGEGYPTAKGKRGSGTCRDLQTRTAVLQVWTQ